MQLAVPPVCVCANVGKVRRLAFTLAAQTQQLQQPTVPDKIASDLRPWKG